MATTVTDLRHDCSRYTPLLAKATTRGIEIRCRDCKALVTWPTTALLPLLLGSSTAVGVVLAGRA